MEFIAKANPFKVGDKVRCIEEDMMMTLRKGRTYTVAKVAGDHVFVTKDIYAPWKSSRFELVESSQSIQQKEKTVSSKFEAAQKVRYTGENFMGLVKGEIYTVYTTYRSNDVQDRVETVEVPHVIRHVDFFEEIKKKVTYSVGQFFTRKNSSVVYMIAQTAAGVVSLICLHDGNRYEEGVKVDSTMKITEEEFSRICSGKEFVEVGLDYSIIQTPSK